jgi:predicted nucleic acid-binding protein
VTFVVDASITLAWFYLDERTSATDVLLSRAADQGAWAPSHWPLEVANTLLQGVRRRRHDQALRDAALVTLASLPVAIDPETGTRAWAESLGLATRRALTIYDACYLELAMRRDLPLATLDRELRRAAEAEGVPLLGA